MLFKKITQLSLILSLTCLSSCQATLDANTAPEPSETPAEEMPQDSEKPSASAEPSEGPDTEPSEEPSPTPEPTATPTPSPSPSQEPSPEPSAKPKAKAIELIPNALPAVVQFDDSPPVLGGTVKYDDGSEKEGVAYTISEGTAAIIQGNRLVPQSNGEVTITFYALTNPGLKKTLTVTIEGSLTSSPDDDPDDDFELADVTGELTDMDSYGSELYVSDTKDDQIYVVNLETGAIKEKIDVCDNPNNIDVSPDGDLLYVACGGTPAIDVIDLDELEWMDRYSLDAVAFDVVSSDDRLYVSYATTIHDPPVILDAATGEKLADFPDTVDGQSRLELTANHKTLYVGATGVSPAALYKVDVSDDLPTLVAEDEHGDLGSNLREIRLSADENHVYVACGSPYYIQEVDADTIEVVGQYETEPYPDSVDRSKNGEYLVASHQTKDVKIFDVDSHDLLKKIQYSVVINDVHVTHNQKSIYALMEGSLTDNLIKVIDFEDL